MTNLDVGSIVSSLVFSYLDKRFAGIYPHKQDTFKLLSKSIYQKFAKHMLANFDIYLFKK